MSFVQIQADLRERYPDEFGGAWIDADGHAHIAIAGSDSVVRAAVATSTNIGVTFHQVEWSEIELLAELEQFRKLTISGPDFLRLGDLDIASAYVDLPTSSVVINVLNGSTQQQASFEELLGPAVTFKRTESKPTPVACVNRQDCGSPLKAGLRMFFPNGLDACVTAFQAFNVTGDYILSAGHCHSDVYNTRYHPAGTKIGAVQGWVVADRIDAMYIKLAVGAGVSNKLYAGSAGIISITSIEQLANEVVGEPVCSSKRSDGTGAPNCGQLLHNHVVVNNLYEQREATNQFACAGDSGSPVYNGGKAIGVLDYSSGDGNCTNPSPNSYYSHIYYVQDEWQLLVRTT